MAGAARPGSGGGGSARHAPTPEDDEPFIPGDAVADVHAHTTRSDGVLTPASIEPGVFRQGFTEQGQRVAAEGGSD